LLVDDLWVFLALMCVIYFLTDFGLGALWATYQDIGGNNAGSVLGFANMCGNLGAAYFGVQIGYLADAKQWPLVFVISAASFAIVAACWFFVDPTRHVFPSDDRST
jgi:nitrate/nitrite transporter NarK